MDKEYAKYLLEKTKNDYNLIAENFSSTRYSIWPELNILGGYIKGGDKILDLGCGNGRFLELFKEIKVDYMGVDNSEKLIEITNKKYPGKKFQVADALNLPFPDNYFDKIFSIAVLHHIPSGDFRNQFIKEAKRVLKPGGLLIITVWKFHQFKEIYLLFKYTILRLFGKTKLDWKDIFRTLGRKD